ncbi:translation initiation factor IF-2 N-terminal domain-containing protein [Saccharomonospora xinjiangensis]|uniref:translation initiation factor IF-2 N-terminal domain-containing protein n=1 Tax=Saccharomonospora xinjiangensis TaxID=75294 RepID=UPI00106F33F0|nr:translation initiation factor IF-2 N-terminal domain-containing protein [Saccharomonospora xinjiangensis]QBQ59730.1 Ribonuclease G [Saccharomonospora xinjiangensis]
MSNAETPAENAGGTAATPTARALAELPDKTRVHVLAKLLGTSSREVLATLAQLGHTARSPQSGVAKDVAVRVAEALGATPQPGATTETEGHTEEPGAKAAGPAAEGSADSTGGTDSTGGVADTGAPVRTRDSERPSPGIGTETGTATADEPVRADVKKTNEAAAVPGVTEPEREAPRRAATVTPPTAPFAAATPQALTPPALTPPVRAQEPAPPHTPIFAAPSPLFLPPDPVTVTAPSVTPAQQDTGESEEGETEHDQDRTADGGGEGEGGSRRRRRRGRRGRGRGKGGDDAGTGDEQQESPESEQQDEDTAPEEEPQAKQENGAGERDEQAETETASRRRRRRRRRKSGDDDHAETAASDDPPNTVVHVREAKPAEEKEGKAEDGVRSVRGSTRLEAKRQRRRDGREAGRRRAPILSESEFLARRESVERTMVVAERGDSTQIGVLEDGVLVEHFVTSAGTGSIVGNVYLGRVQNVLPSMEAAFIDIGRGRNAVLYAGEVDWDAAGLEGKARKIEQALSSGDHVLVQVTKDPVGHKGARLTTQISLPGRFLVYVPSGGATGISRKLPENERRRLKDILKRIVPTDAGVIIRTASEGVTESELARDVRRLEAQWQVIKEKADAANGKKGSAPVLLYEEPDLLVKVVRDLFTEDFSKLEIQGGTAWETIHSYVEHVAPDLLDRVKRYVGTGDVFADYRIDEQLMKALDRKVWLPSGGYLVIDRTEAMTVIDVNTGKFTGSGGNLEETVTRNNLESAEEIVRQLRLRDIGGIIVIDFIDMVLESNRELVLRRLTECLGRDRTRHQVAEVTSLGLVQMTRKRVGTGLLEAFSTTCEHCKGRGVIVSTEPQRGNGHGGGGANHGHHGAHQGGQHTSRRSRKAAKAAEQEAAKSAEQAPQVPTPEQRESVVSAVQAVANASKVVATKSAETPQEQKATESRAPREPDESRATSRETGAGRPEAAREPAEHRNGAVPPAPERAEPAKEKSAEHARPATRDDEPVIPAPAPRVARRPRRAASRPAGPPVPARDNG